jgi:hypothetical protein
MSLGNQTTDIKLSTAVRAVLSYTICKHFNPDELESVTVHRYLPSVVTSLNRSEECRFTLISHLTRSK